MADEIQPDMTPPEFEPDMTDPDSITAAVCDWPTEPLDAGHDGMAQGAPVAMVARAATTLLRAITRTEPFTMPGTTQYIRRAEWGARAPSGRYPKLSGHPAVTFHWEGPFMGAFSHDKCAGKIRTIQNFHMDTRHWLDIAYNAVVCPHRYIYEGRGYWNRSAANGTNIGNSASYAVCYLSGQGDPLTDGAKMAFLDTLLLFRQNAGASDDTKVHQDWLATACPGPDIVAWERAGCPPPPGYSTMPDPAAPIPPPNGGGVTSDQIADTIGFIDDPTSDGGWLVTKSGGIFTKAPAAFYGSLGAVKLNAPIAAFLPTPTGKGYWLFGEDGGVFGFGDAPFNGAYAAFGDEYRAGQRKLAGAYFRGNPADRSTWRYSYVSNRLESYDI